MMVRPARQEDAKQIAEIHVASWQAAYNGLLPEDFLNSLSVESRANYWKNVLSEETNTIAVCEKAGEVKGFVFCGKCRDEDSKKIETGEIYAIYLSPDVWRKGYGTALWNKAIALLREQNFKRVTLWVLEGNERALRFYQHFGLQLDGEQKVETHPSGIELRERRLIAKIPKESPSNLCL